MERELRESEERFRNLVEIANDGIIIADSEKNIIMFNRKAEEIFGYKREEVIGKKASLSLFPLDAVWPIRRALDRLKPRVLVVAETEIWPVLVTEACRREIKIVLVNGRMSVRAFGRYKLIARSLRHLLECYDRFFFKSDEDRDRYVRFGVSPVKSQVAGDMKFDAPLLPRSDGRVKELRARLGVPDKAFLFLAGSTRPGEEELLLRVFKELSVRHPQLRLVLAPRHPERVPEVESLLGAAGMTVRRYSDGLAHGDTDRVTVSVVDLMGVLGDLYLAADLAFVGGTLVEIGGHNILEPVWARTPVVFGPHINNVREAASYIGQNNFGVMVDSADAISTLIEAMLSGSRTFAARDEAQWRRSATALAGSYILELGRER